MALVKICPVCKTACRSPYPMECPLCFEDLSMVPVTEESVNSQSVSTDDIAHQRSTWVFVSEDGQARLPIKSGDTFDIGREHTLKEYLSRFSMVGRLQARLTADNDKLTITNLGRTNRIMVDRAIIWEDQVAELNNDSKVILGRNPDEMGGYDDRDNCAFFRVEKISD